MIRRKRFWALALVIVTCLATVILVGADKAYQAPRVRLHGGATWLASSKVGQLALLDGASAEVAAKVPVAPPGTAIRSSQLGSTGYALNLWDNSVVRVDGATLQPSQPSKPLGATLFPTPQILYALDADRGLLTALDPVTLTPRSAPHSLAAKVTPDGAIVDGGGRLWLLDQRTGDLAWFTADSRHSREHAGTAERTRIAVASGHPALLDLDQRQASLLDPETGSVLSSVRADVRPDDTVSVTGSPAERRILISIASRGLLMACTFDAACQDPIPLGAGKADLGAAVEVNNHAIVPDYSTGRVWIVNLATMRVVVDRQLFTRPVRFELLARDGIVFYNDPDSDQAGVLDLEGNVRAVSKYNPTRPETGPVEVAANSPSTPKQSSPPTNRPRSGPTGNVPPVSGPGRFEPNPPTAVGAPLADIVIKPRSRGLVGDEFELSVVSRSPIGIATARWTFGDGTEATGLVVRHRWNRPGEFQINVAPTTTIGLAAPIATATVIIEPADTPPRIDSISIDPESPRVGEPVRFSAGVSGRWPDRWEWIIQDGQGTETVSSLPEFRHTFTAPGTYTVTLAVLAGAVRVQQSRQLTVAPEPPPVRCGDVLTASAMLKSDLVCPNDIGIAIAGDNVTLDLGGHTLSTDTPSESSTGIKVAGSRTIQDTTIKNGTLTRFKTGIGLSNVSGVRLSALTVASSADANDFEKNAGDIYGVNARDVQISSTSLTGGAPFIVQDNSDIGIAKSVLSNNAQERWGRGQAICTNGSRCTISESTLKLFLVQCSSPVGESLNSSLSVESSDVDSVSIGRECDSVTVKNNSRILPFGSMGARFFTMTGNIVSPPGSDEMAMASVAITNAVIHISGNDFSGIQIGLRTSWTTGLITRNTFTANSLIGLNVDSPDPHEISHNLFTGNGHSEKDPASDVLRGGLIVDAPFNEHITVSDNRSRDNFGYGMRAVEPTTGTGNTSSGDQLGCVGIKCE
ncbi:PKD domain-containing protein [Kibdelosporangium aridum]|uniref:PKD domain-containing protein n=1 Tax=Kibdelosporangium aridum TaxID=2030 RepID=A0A428ZQS7_KIBAR|nr:PKD domain-containing protein [Kibdelosporangium aridum]RSM90412.1 PKD domain-containing protein [Kibdelosporangium aridum]